MLTLHNNPLMPRSEAGSEGRVAEWRGGNSLTLFSLNRGHSRQDKH